MIGKYLSLDKHENKIISRLHAMQQIYFTTV